jgi:hypothetical protein
MRNAAVALGLAAALLGGCAGPSAPPESTGPLELRLEDARDDPRAGEILVFRAVFRNPGPVPLAVFTPQDGSFDGRVPPAYGLDVVSVSDGRPVEALPAGCGNCGGVYDRRSRVEVPAGGESAVRVAAPWFPEAPGRYRVRMTYAVHTGEYPGPRLSLPAQDPPDRGPWPPGVFVGSVVSEPIEIECARRD